MSVEEHQEIHAEVSESLVELVTSLAAVLEDADKGIDDAFDLLTEVPPIQMETEMHKLRPDSINRAMATINNNVGVYQLIQIGLTKHKIKLTAGYKAFKHLVAAKKDSFKIIATRGKETLRNAIARLHVSDESSMLARVESSLESVNTLAKLVESLRGQNAKTAQDVKYQHKIIADLGLSAGLGSEKPAERSQPVNFDDLSDEDVKAATEKEMPLGEALETLSEGKAAPTINIEDIFNETEPKSLDESKPISEPTPDDDPGVKEKEKGDPSPEKKEDEKLLPDIPGDTKTQPNKAVGAGEVRKKGGDDAADEASLSEGKAAELAAQIFSTDADELKVGKKVGNDDPKPATGPKEQMAEPEEKPEKSKKKEPFQNVDERAAKLVTEKADSEVDVNSLIEDTPSPQPNMGEIRIKAVVDEGKIKKGMMGYLRKDYNNGLIGVEMDENIDGSSKFGKDGHCAVINKTSVEKRDASPTVKEEPTPEAITSEAPKVLTAEDIFNL